MIRIMAAAAVICLICSTASAQQQPNPVVQHYRAYQAALERNDLAAAEASAAEALAAAEAANDSRTGALVFNLATVRFLRGDAANAVAPAQRALALAEQNPNGPVAPELARLVLSRAELGAGAEGAADRLDTALREGRAARLDDAELYDGALELAVWSSNNRRFMLAQSAWALADDHAAGSRYPINLARARAKLGQSQAIFQHEMGRRRGEDMNYENALVGYALVNEAYALMRQLASIDVPGGDLTVAQQAYAEIVAWRGMWRIKILDEDYELPAAVAEGDADGLVEMLSAPTPLTSQRCLVNLRLTEPPRYPSGAAARGELGSLAVRIRINAAGEVEDSTVVARIGSEEFEQAVNRVSDEWEVERREDSPANCRMEMSVIRSFTFRIGGASDGVSGFGRGAPSPDSGQRQMN
ncbi:MAG: energy transducer TonB [Hyphomonadaceae bacterium]|nr:energy transducer TonB [Hyphomonadaceae bacterium]